MDLSLEDLRLINVLQWAPRASWSSLAPILDRHPTRLATRWAALRDAGIAWVLAYDSPDAGRDCTAFLTCTVSPGSFEGVVGRLQDMARVASVEDGIDQSDLQLTVLTSSYEELAADVLPALRADPDVVAVSATLATRPVATGAHWRLDMLSAAQERAVRRLAPAPTAPQGDKPAGYDTLVRVLQVDGRADVATLAAAMGVHASTAGRRLRQASDSGLLSFRCDVAQYDSGFPVLCQWYVRVHPDEEGALLQWLLSLRSLRLCMMTTGRANLRFSLWLRHPGEIHDVDARLLGVAPGARILHTDAGVRMYKRMGRRIGADSRASGPAAPW